MINEFVCSCGNICGEAWELGGLFGDVEKGISLGCPLSPLIVAICLMPVDQLLTSNDLFYIRFMHDGVVSAKMRRHLRRAVQLTHQILEQLKPGKTAGQEVHRVNRKGMGFSGDHFLRKRLQVAQSTLVNL